MKREEILSWFESIQEKRGRLFLPEKGTYYKNNDEVSAWLTEARSAIEASFPFGHAVRENWYVSTAPIETKGAFMVTAKSVVDAATGVFQSAYSQVKAGYLSSLVDGIRSETEAEIIDQAGNLLSNGYLAAAAVIAGGALESHLLHLCKRADLKWKGDGSISKYNGAIGEARNKGNEVYNATEGKLVESWGGIRNEAAHSPGSFNRKEEEVRLMIDGIRQFLVRVP